MLRLLEVEGRHLRETVTGNIFRLSMSLTEILSLAAVPQTSARVLISEFQMRVAVSHRVEKLLRFYGAAKTG